MSVEGVKIYPGAEATALQVLELADEYRRSADSLRRNVRARKPLSAAPFRLVAIQAIELYLNALMLKRGSAPTRVRALQHNLSARALFAKTNGLDLRKGTFRHLHELQAFREYLISRYGPELSVAGSQLNRLEATLRDVADKVTTIVRQP